MTTMIEITRTIKKARRDGSSDNSIAHRLGVSAAEIGRLAKGKYPGESVALRLGIKVKCSRCHRSIPKKTERQPVPKIGRDAGWIEYYMRKIK